MTNHLVPPDTVVRVNGQVLPVADVIIHGRIAAEVDSPHTGTHGIITTTADITWLPSSGRPDHPWLPGFPVKDGDEVTVDLEWPDKTSRRFTGRVLYTWFDITTGTVNSKCHGLETDLDVEGTVPPLAYIMPPVERNGDSRWVGMAPGWITGHLLRQAGFSATAPLQDEAVVFLSNEGSAWATVGRTIAAWSKTRGFGLAPYARQTSWGGVALVDPYIEAVGDYPYGSGAPLSLVVDLGDPRSGGLDDATITVTDVSGNGIGLELDGHDLHMLSIASDTPTVEGTLTRAEGCTRVQVSYDPSTTTLEMLVDRLAPAESYPTASVNINVTATEWNVVVDADYADIGAVQPYRSLANLVDAPRMVRHRRDAYDIAQNGGIGAVPYIKGRKVIDVLAEQADREWLDLWVDESGVVQVCDRDELETQAPVKVITDAVGPDLVGLPVNGFGRLPDGTPTPGRPYPEDDTGISTSSSTLDGYTTDHTGRYATMINSGSSAATGQRSLQMLVPIREGELNTFYAETRSPGGHRGALRARYYDADGDPMGPVEVIGEPAGGTMEWTQVQVKLGKAPVGAAYARVDAINADTFAAFGEIHWRNFTTYGPGVMLKALAARTPGLGQFGRVVVNRQRVDVETRKRPILLFWEAGKENILPGDEYVRFASPRSANPEVEVHWLADAIDTSVEYAGSATDYPLNMREGSIVGGQMVDEDDDPIDWVTESEWPLVVEFLDYDTVKISGTVDDTLPAGATQVVTIPYQGSATVSASRKTESTMQIRGYGWARVGPADPVFRSVNTGRGRDYVHDGAWYLQSEYQANAVADKLANWINNPREVVEQLDTPLVDVIRGDRVLVALRNIAGVTLDVKVIGIDENHAAGAMSLTAQVLDAEVTSLTLAQIPDIDDFLSA